MKFRSKIREAAGSLFKFTPAQVRGIVFMLPLLAVVGIIIALANRPRFEESFLELADAADSSARFVSAAPVPADAPATDTLFFFDPNTVTLQELCLLGFTTRTAAGIIKYRQSGKRFEIPEDFATCYGVSIEDYTRLEPYIRIGEQYKAKPASRPAMNARKSAAKSTIALHSFDPNALDRDGFVALGFSAAQADVIIRYRHSIGGFKDFDDFARCYVVSDGMARELAPYAVFAAEDQVAVEPAGAAPATATGAPVEINTADSAALLSVRGIGEVLVVRIMEYRGRLGGFVSASQLAEIKGMSPENLQLICEQIRVDSCEIQKIDVNFAPHKTLVEQMGRHPYVTDAMLRKLLKNRQLKGGWSTIGDMIEENIMTGKQAEKLAPYLLFRGE